MWPFTKKEQEYKLHINPLTTITAVQVSQSILPLIKIWEISKWGFINQEIVNYAKSKLDGYIVEEEAI